MKNKKLSVIKIENIKYELTQIQPPKNLVDEYLQNMQFVEDIWSELIACIEKGESEEKISQKIEEVNSEIIPILTYWNTIK